jgi:aminobenzoyl-glutamate utilization protein B
MGLLATEAIAYIDKKSGFLSDVSDKVWRFAEPAFQEVESSKVLAKVLSDEGFDVKMGVGDMTTAFVATWGKGKPIIGFLGEYDALAGLSQDCVPERKVLVEGEAGHGCGHNLLGTGALGGAIGLKKQMEAHGLKGTIRYYGCPAEENLSGKAFMAREGIFNDCDACLTWHPDAISQVWNMSYLANNAVNVSFRGRTAHAAGDPFNGRSALDAVQLSNMGVEFLREHMPSNARVHYVITDGGLQPNVVPAFAKVWYLVRSPERYQVDELYERVLNCVKGAALMTGTTYELDLIKAIYNTLNNTPLEALLEDVMLRVGPAKWSESDEAFARKISESIPWELREGDLKQKRPSREEYQHLKDRLLADIVLKRNPVPETGMGSTDVGDVSWCCPTAQFGTACQALGTPGHSWQYAAQAGMSIGHKGMLQAAKILAEAGYELMTKPELLVAAKKDFDDRRGGRDYKSAMPADQKPALNQFAKKR